jgi:integration host factor subunit alpha
VELIGGVALLTVEKQPKHKIYHRKRFPLLKKKHMLAKTLIILKSTRFGPWSLCPHARNRIEAWSGPEHWVQLQTEGEALKYSRWEERMDRKTLTKADIVDHIYEQTDRNRAEIKTQVEILLETMKQAIKDDDALLVSGFGKFEAYQKKARKGRNPQTTQTITLPARKVIVFRLSRKFRADLNPQE